MPENPVETAREWIRTDPQGCADDVKRLGLDEAVDYQMRLIADRAAADDDRWDGITEDAMRTALAELVAEKPETKQHIGHYHERISGFDQTARYQRVNVVGSDEGGYLGWLVTGDALHPEKRWTDPMTREEAEQAIRQHDGQLYETPIRVDD